VHLYDENEARKDRKSKWVQDSIHGMMRLRKEAVEIIDTPPFQVTRVSAKYPQLPTLSDCFLSDVVPLGRSTAPPPPRARAHLPSSHAPPCLPRCNPDQPLGSINLQYTNQLQAATRPLAAGHVPLRLPHGESHPERPFPPLSRPLRRQLPPLTD
jgi:hypothetical protein